MVSQLVLGEVAEVLSISERWIQVRTMHDGYPGWVGKSQMKFLGQAETLEWLNHPLRARSPYRTFRAFSDLEAVTVPPGSFVVFDEDQIILPGLTLSVQAEPDVIKGETVLDTALNFMGAPYLWGGRSDTGIDCSGFTQMCYGLHACDLPRDSGDQYKVGGITGDSIAAAQRGDLLYFGESTERISHVGFYLGEGSLLHASGNVRINNIDYSKRYVNRFPYNERLAGKLVGVQTSRVFEP